ncbi:hypothetical protein L596_005351 [Steinernema carpocapsae]|uniref:Uncharacterized protein n=1 Tax=Steinernema carpocapsae TaxID=34508 RepID=A0A4V6I8N2_STECR|nr:hypothetical protein L596_005351 [Steinernema carpocapsae]
MARWHKGCHPTFQKFFGLLKFDGTRKHERTNDETVPKDITQLIIGSVLGKKARNEIELDLFIDNNA